MSDFGVFFYGLVIVWGMGSGARRWEAIGIVVDSVKSVNSDSGFYKSDVQNVISLRGKYCLAA